MVEGNQGQNQAAPESQTGASASTTQTNIPSPPQSPLPPESSTPPHGATSFFFSKEMLEKAAADAKDDTQIDPLSLQANETVQQLLPQNLMQQEPYVPSKTKGRFIAENPIHFTVNGAPGISISQAADKVYTGLECRDERLSAFKSTSARLQNPGRHNNSLDEHSVDIFFHQFTGYNQYTPKAKHADHDRKFLLIPYLVKHSRSHR